MRAVISISSFGTVSFVTRITKAGTERSLNRVGSRPVLQKFSSAGRLRGMLVYRSAVRKDTSCLI